MKISFLVNAAENPPAEIYLILYLSSEISFMGEWKSH